MKVKNTAERAGKAVKDGYSSTVAKAGDIYAGARESASAARRSAADGVDANPLAAVVGGLALGVLVGSLLPRTRREVETIGRYGRELTSRARDAAEAARAVGVEKLDELGFSKDSAKQTVQQLVDTAKTAAVEAGSAAARRAGEDATGSNRVQPRIGRGSATS